MVSKGTSKLTVALSKNLNELAIPGFLKITNVQTKSQSAHAHTSKRKKGHVVVYEGIYGPSYFMSLC